MKYAIHILNPPEYEEAIALAHTKELEQNKNKAKQTTKGSSSTQSTVANQVANRQNDEEEH